MTNSLCGKRKLADSFIPCDLTILLKGGLNLEPTTANNFNSLTTEKQTTKFSSANFQKILNPSYTILRIQRLEGKQCRS